MNFRSVRIVRVFLSQRDAVVESLLNQLHDRWNVHGVTVYQGVAGFGGSRKIHAARILDLSYDLPVTIEFYDSPERIDQVLSELEGIKPGHVVSWMADMWMGDDS